MLKAKIIRPSRSPWSSPVVVVRKSDKSMRVCIDYRKLNKITHTEKLPIPDPRDIFDRLRDSAWFTASEITKQLPSIILLRSLKFRKFLNELPLISFLD